MNKPKSRRSSKVKAGKNQARARYRNEGRAEKNKLVKQERHKKRLEKAEGKPVKILPSELKRRAKRARKSAKPAEAA